MQQQYNNNNLMVRKLLGTTSIWGGLKLLIALSGISNNCIYLIIGHANSLSEVRSSPPPTPVSSASSVTSIAAGSTLGSVVSSSANTNSQSFSMPSSAAVSNMVGNSLPLTTSVSYERLQPLQQLYFRIDLFIVYAVLVNYMHFSYHSLQLTLHCSLRSSL